MDGVSSTKIIQLGPVSGRTHSPPATSGICPLSEPLTSVVASYTAELSKGLSSPLNLLRLVSPVDLFTPSTGVYSNMGSCKLTDDTISTPTHPEGLAVSSFTALSLLVIAKLRGKRRT